MENSKTLLATAVPKNGIWFLRKKENMFIQTKNATIKIPLFMVSIKHKSGKHYIFQTEYQDTKIDGDIYPDRLSSFNGIFQGKIKKENITINFE